MINLSNKIKMDKLIIYSCLFTLLYLEKFWNSLLIHLCLTVKIDHLDKSHQTDAVFLQIDFKVVIFVQLVFDVFNVSCAEALIMFYILFSLFQIVVGSFVLFNWHVREADVDEAERIYWFVLKG